MKNPRSATCLLAVTAATACATGAGKHLQDPVTVPFDSPLNLILLEARLDGSEPLRFLLDSGASGSVIDSEVVRRLSIDTTTPTTRRSTAAGSEVTVAQVPGGLSLTLAPGFEIQLARVIAAPFSESARVIAGEHMDGILGYEVFSLFTIEVDYAKRALTFHDPRNYTYKGDAAELELEFPERFPRLPFIRGSVRNGSKERIVKSILVDSGGQTMATVGLGSRADWDELISPENRIIEALGATGLSNDPEGTTHGGLITQMDRFTLGPFTFEDPLVIHSGGGPEVSLFGASLLHRFTAVFDYSRKRLLLEPNEHFDDPFHFDQSGAMLIAPSGEDGLSVMFVAAGTPADAAGLRIDDRILAINGTAVTGSGLNDVRRMLSGPGVFRIRVRRDDAEFEARMETGSLF